MASEASEISKKNEPKTIISTRCVCCSEDIARGLPSARGRRILSGGSAANSAQQNTLCGLSQDMANFYELFPKKETLICSACFNTLSRISSMQEKLKNMTADLDRQVSTIQNGVKPFVQQFMPFRVKSTTDNDPAVKSEDSQRIQVKVPPRETKEQFVGGNSTYEMHPVQDDPVLAKKRKLDSIKDQEIKNIAENSYVKIKPRPAESMFVPMRVVGILQKGWKAPESSGSSNDEDGSSGVPETLSCRVQFRSVETAVSRVSGQSEQEMVPSNIIEIKPEHIKSTASSLSCISETLHGSAPKESVSVDTVISRVSCKHYLEGIESNCIKMELESEKCVTLPSVSDVKQMTVHVSHVIPDKPEEGYVIKQEK